MRAARSLRVRPRRNRRRNRCWALSAIAITPPGCPFRYDSEPIILEGEERFKTIGEHELSRGRVLRLDAQPR
jgi:hypothetical protein